MRLCLTNLHYNVLTVIYYRVIVHTGHKALDPEAKAYVVLFGESGESQEFQLEHHEGGTVFQSDG